MLTHDETALMRRRVNADGHLGRRDALLLLDEYEAARVFAPSPPPPRPICVTLIESDEARAVPGCGIVRNADGSVRIGHPELREDEPPRVHYDEDSGIAWVERA